MIRPTDRETVAGPMPDPKNPQHCIRCDQDLFYECTKCNALLGNRAPTSKDTCPHCGAINWTGPRCICSICDCGED